MLILATHREMQFHLKAYGHTSLCYTPSTAFAVTGFISCQELTYIVFVSSLKQEHYFEPKTSLFFVLKNRWSQYDVCMQSFLQNADRICDTGNSTEWITHHRCQAVDHKK